MIWLILYIISYVITFIFSLYIICKKDKELLVGDLFWAFLFGFGSIVTVFILIGVFYSDVVIWRSKNNY